MKILLLDIETAPHLATVWGMWQQNIGISQLIQPGYTLCWSAKWYGEKEILFSSLHRTSPRVMLRRIHRLLNEADVVVHYNGRKFDIPTLNKEFLMLGMTPPAPYQQVDLYQTVKSKFRMASNKLDFVSQQLGLGAKTKHKGHELWMGCMNGDAQSWAEMQEYNKQDVVLLEKLYDVMRPWLKSHANHSMNGEHVCPVCGSKHLQSRGMYKSETRVYRRYQCNDCGKWSRNVASEKKSGAAIRLLEA